MVDKDANETQAGLTSKDAQERVLGYSQPSLRDWAKCKIYPGLTSWATFSDFRPCGTELWTDRFSRSP
jgi:hypothetical protein